MKGLPSGYNKDLQEDKEAVFDAEATLAAVLDACAAVVAGLTLERARARRRAASGLLLATDVADYLVAQGRAVPRRPRDCRRDGAQAARRRAATSRRSASTSGARSATASTPTCAEAVTAQASVAAKRTPQSTNPEAVRAALDELTGWLGGGRP